MASGNEDKKQESNRQESRQEESKKKKATIVREDVKFGKRKEG